MRICLPVKTDRPELDSISLELSVRRHDCRRLPVPQLLSINDADKFDTPAFVVCSRPPCPCISRKLPRNICSHG